MEDAIIECPTSCLSGASRQGADEKKSNFLRLLRFFAANNFFKGGLSSPTLANDFTTKYR
jgi:hypothetical protein